MTLDFSVAALGARRHRRKRLQDSEVSVSTWQVCTQTISPGWGWGWNEIPGNIQGPRVWGQASYLRKLLKDAPYHNEWVFMLPTAQVHFAVVYLHLPKRIKNTQPRQNLHTNLLSNVIHNTQKTGTTPGLSTDGSFPGGSDSKESICNAGDPGSIHGSGRSPGEGHGNPFQYSCLENPVDSGTWLAIVHGVTKSQTRLSDSHFSTDERIKWMCYIHSVDIIQLSMWGMRHWHPYSIQHGGTSKTC